MEKAMQGGPGSFCVPRRVVQALLDNQASAYEICAYLVLARFTDETGQYSTASLRAVNTYTGANKGKGGPVDRALTRLQSIRARSVARVHNGRSGRSHAMIDKITDLGPILYSRESWFAETGELPPDGPTARSEIRYILPDFGEDAADRVWFGNNLVSGVGGFAQPLKALKNAGDVAARLLLELYQANDMETWGGVNPYDGPWCRYEPVGSDVYLNVVRLHRAKMAGKVAWISNQVCTDKAQYWDALTALNSSGLVYEVVMAINRNAEPKEFSSGEKYGAIPEGAEPLYELDCLSKHGYKPEGEHGLAWATAKTAGDFGYSVAEEGGFFNGTYAAFVPDGYGCMIAGIYRLRFRVSNPKNAGVKGAWAGIAERNRDALELINRARRMHKRDALNVQATAERVQSTA